MAKAKRKAAVYSDFGTPERKQHNPIVVETVPDDMEDTKNRDRARVIETDDPLYRARRQRQITARERDAGLILRGLWIEAGKVPNVISQYKEQIGRGSVVSLHVSSIDHYKRYKAALRLLTPNVKSAVIAVCCYEERLGYGKAKYLKAGLRKLQRHFGA